MYSLRTLDYYLYDECSTQMQLHRHWYNAFYVYYFLSKHLLSYIHDIELGWQFFLSGSITYL